MPTEDTTQDDAKRLEVLALCAEGVPSSDAVEAALARALVEAAMAGRFDVVAQLARELEPRRLSRAGNVVQLDAGRHKEERRDAR